MNDLQVRLTAILFKFNEVCAQNNLRYFLLGGTALGTARHQGFIPWDDDIDVGMPREDYEKLKEISTAISCAPYCFEFPGAKDFVYTFGKMYDTTTTLVENTRFKTKRGIYLDIFPLDGVGNTIEESVQNFRRVEKKLNLLSTKTCAWRKGRKLYKNLAMVLLRHMPGVSIPKLMLEIEEISKQKKYDDCQYVVNYAGNWREKEIAQKEWFGTPRLYQFETIEVFGPENIDAYLTAVYGDWRTLPPKEKQVSHHDYIYLNLTQGYKK